MKHHILIASLAFAIACALKLALTPPELADDMPPMEEIGPPVSVQSQAFKPKALRSLDLSAYHIVYLNTLISAQTATLIIKELYSFKSGPIMLVITSRGGSLMDGARIIAAVQNVKVPVSTLCVDNCSSMAAMIFEYGTKRYATDRSVLMFHPVSITNGLIGELDKILSQLLFIQRYAYKIDDYIARRSHFPNFLTALNTELRFDAEDARDKHFVDEVVSVDLSLLANYELPLLDLH